MVFISDWVYKIWVGEDIIIPFSLTVALGFFSISLVMVAPYTSYINGIGKLNLSLVVNFIGIIIYLILVFVFKNVFSNSTGIAMAFVCTQTISLIAEPMQVHRILNKTAKGIWNK